MSEYFERNTQPPISPTPKTNPMGRKREREALTILDLFLRSLWSHSRLHAQIRMRLRLRLSSSIEFRNCIGNSIGMLAQLEGGKSNCSHRRCPCLVVGSRPALGRTCLGNRIGVNLLRNASGGGRGIALSSSLSFRRRGGRTAVVLDFEMRDRCEERGCDWDEVGD
jgi:hypothetical protein